MAATDSRTSIAGPPAPERQQKRELWVDWTAMARSKPRTAIALRRVSATRRGRQVLHNLDLTVDTGEMVACVVPDQDSGTALVDLVTGVMPPDRGELKVAGLRLDGLTVHELACLRRPRPVITLSHVEKFQLVPCLTVAQNLRMPFDDMIPAEQDRRADALAARVGLSHRSADDLSVLDRGESLRVAIARALADRPLVLVADDPSAGLSSEQTSRVMVCLAMVPKDGVAVLVTTERQDIARWADRTVAVQGVEVSP